MSSDAEVAATVAVFNSVYVAFLEALVTYYAYRHCLTGK